MSEPTIAEPTKSFTGRGRRVTRKRVKYIDRLMRAVITIGGWGVVAAFIGIVVHISREALPLFKSPQVSQRVHTDLNANASAAVPLTMGVDEDLANLWVLYANGTLGNYATTTGELSRLQEVTDQPITAFSNARGSMALGFADGTVRIGQVRWEGSYIKDLSDAMETLRKGQTMVADNNVIFIDQSGNYRATSAVLTLDDAVTIADDDVPVSPIRLIDYMQSERTESLVVMREDGRVFFSQIEKRFNLITNKQTVDASSHELPIDNDRKGEPAVALLMGGGGEQVYVVYEDGHLVRYNTRDLSNARIAERSELLPGGKAKVTSVRMLLGNNTIIVGDSLGGVNGWLAAASTDSRSNDGVIMTLAHQLEPHSAPVTAIGISARDRQFITGDTRGHLIVRHMTSGNTQVHLALPDGKSVSDLLMAPKNNAILSVATDRFLQLWDYKNPHADGSLRAMFAPIHYEGYPHATMVYQSSASQDSAEPKYSLWPLILGTLKATFYAMLFATPIAILAAIYSSEFMSPRVRTVIKPTIELMASLPSVVLGFIGALVLAPLVEKWLVAVLLSFVAVPIMVLMIGFLWQLLPPRVGRLVPSWTKFVIMCVSVVVAIALSFIIAPLAGRILFADANGVGDLHGWLGSRHGNATPGWFLLFIPINAIILSVVYNRILKPRLNIQDRFETPASMAIFDICRLIVIVLLSIATAYLVALLFTAMGMDLRGTIIGSYSQRNTLIVGMIMGFAIIPIIYTVSEDALSSVPASLRSASLGAGATPWQTAVRVVLPVATSGIFSACMIGFGRAAGETMIVLMASGSTPLWGSDSLSIFNGLRALSANIAVELPEAPRDSTHYRILFFSAVLLFILTFVVNTVAEIVRMRFRKRTMNL